MPKKIVYSEPGSYFPKAVRDQFFKDDKKKTAPKVKEKPKTAKKSK